MIEWISFEEEKEKDDISSKSNILIQLPLGLSDKCAKHFALNF